MSATTDPAAGGIELRRGDVLLKRWDTSSVTHLVIALGQKLGGGSKATTVHAAISLGGERIAESSGGGIAVADLNALYTWKAYRLRGNDELAQLAATVALHLVDRAQRTAAFGQYDTVAATSSAFQGGRAAAAVAGDIGRYVAEVMNEPAGTTREFFCSNFVVQCYAIATEFYYAANAGMPRGPAVMNLDHERASPSDMAEFFEGAAVDWERLGEITG